jgi:UDP-glucose 6-dehydrogenase
MGAKETEATKLFCNAFYAAKLQLFTELYALCQQQHISFDLVRHMMLQQGWIHPMHTQVPGANGIGVGGACLPKDATAMSTWAEADGAVKTPLIESVGKAIQAYNTSTNPT